MGRPIRQILVNTMPVPDAAHSTDKIPVLLLKTRSSLTDAYEDTLKCYVPDGGDIIGGGYEPCFVPVLQHRFNTHGLSTIKSLLRDQKISSSAHGAEYGGMIFTSQRAVEAFAHQVQGSKGTLLVPAPHTSSCTHLSLGISVFISSHSFRWKRTEPR